MNYASIFVYIPSHRTSIVRTTRTAARVDFFAPRCRLSPHTERGAVTRTSLNNAREKKKAKRSRKTNARTTHRAYLCRSRTWKKPRFQPKTQFSWLSLTFSRFARKNVTDVVTTRLRCFASLSWRREQRCFFHRPRKERRWKRRVDRRVFFFFVFDFILFFPRHPKRSPFGFGGKMSPLFIIHIFCARKRSIVVVHKSAQNTTALSLPLPLPPSLSLSLWR